MEEPVEPPRNLRFGLLCDGAELSAFQRDCVERILAVPGVELVASVVNESPAQPASKGQALLRLLKVRGTLWPLFQRALLEPQSAAPDLGFRLLIELVA